MPKGDTAEAGECQGTEAPAPKGSVDPPRVGRMGRAEPLAHTWCLYSLIVVRVYTHFILLHVEGELTQLHGPQLMVAVQVGPSPQAAVDNVGEPLPVGHLQPAIQ